MNNPQPAIRKQKSIADVRKENVAKHKTGKQKYSDFPIGTRVEVIVPCEDMTFFWNEQGQVIRNSGNYLGIIVKFDKKYNRQDFGFMPEDLLILDKATALPPSKADIVNLTDAITKLTLQLSQRLPQTQKLR
jgi:hypothetical protein